VSFSTSANIVSELGELKVAIGAAITKFNVPDNSLLITIRHKQDGHLFDTSYQINTGHVGSADVKGNISEVKVAWTGKSNTIFIDASNGDIASIVIQGSASSTTSDVPTVVVPTDTPTPIPTPIPTQPPPPTQAPPTTPPQNSIPSFPQTADEAAVVFGMSNNDAQLYRAAQGTGWATNNSVRLKIYKGNCVDMPLGAASSVLQGRTAWIYSGVDHDRALMASDGYVTGPATVYWGYCPQA
jgi:hypothetical protein